MHNASEFNATLLADLFLRGYKYILYLVKDEESAILRPLKERAPDELVASLGAYQVAICDQEIIDMAKGDPLAGFKFYVQTDLFEQHE